MSSDCNKGSFGRLELGGGVIHVPKGHDNRLGTTFIIVCAIVGISSFISGS